MRLPALYAIVDAEILDAHGLELRGYAEALAAGGVRLVQYRNKVGAAQEMLRDAAVLSEVFAGSGAALIFNDRVDLAVLAGFNGVHVGQGDLSPEDARRVVGEGRIVGVSTHTKEEVLRADASCADYVAIGPVFATGTKRDASPVVGLEGVLAARAITRKPLVAIGGITLQNARSVLEAGADTLAVVSGLMIEGRAVQEVAQDFCGAGCFSIERRSGS